MLTQILTGQALAAIALPTANVLHYQVHQLILEYQYIQIIDDSAQRLQQAILWQRKMQEYCDTVELKQVR